MFRQYSISPLGTVSSMRFWRAHRILMMRGQQFFSAISAQRAKAASSVWLLDAPDETIFAGSLSAGLLRRAEHYLPIEWVRSAFEILHDGDIVPVPPGT